MLAEKNIQSIRCKHRKHSFTKKDQYLVQDFFPFLKYEVNEYKLDKKFANNIVILVYFSRPNKLQ